LSCGPIYLDSVAEMLAWLESGFDDFPARDRHRLATSRIQDLLAMEVPASDGATGKGPGADSAHPADVVGQSHLGQSSHSR
jgi:hypothetical protein